MNFANFQNQTLHRNDDVSVNKTPRERFSGEWETRQLAELGRFSKGRGIKRKDVSYEGLLCVRYGELYTQYHNYIEEVVSRVPPSVAATALPISTGDLLFAGSGETAEEIGRCAAYLGKEKAYAGGDIIVLTPANQNSTYLGHLMNHSIVAVQKARMAQGDAVVHISTNSLAQVQVELPPIAEQNAIAEVLSDVDGLIGALDALIAKKRAIKQATMQQLLTGKTRLPGFSGEWSKTRIRDLLTYRRPDPYIVQSAEYLEHGDVPVLTANKSFVLGYTDELSGVCRDLPAIIFDDFTTDSKYATFPFKVKSSAIKLLYGKHERVSLKYVFERMQLIRFSLGNHKRYYISEYQNLEVLAPDYHEQHAIAQVLSEMDAEVAALEQRRDKTRAIKQGMMQQLLTGRVRLVKSE